MRHYSHIARDRMQKTSSWAPAEFECGQALDKEAEKELHAIIGGGAISRRLAELSHELVNDEFKN